MPIATDPSAIANSDAERRAIVKLYDKGCHVSYDAKESIQLSNRIDHNGFIQDKPIKEVFSKKSRKIGDERLIKWMKMVKDDNSWSKYSNSDKLARRIYKGIPHGLRGLVWTRLLNIERSSKEHEGIYEKMKTAARERSPDIRQIDLDVNRTLRDNELFHDRYSSKQKQLFHVLAAYSLYNIEVGYCQSAFWAMSTLMSNSKYAMHGFFIPSFPKLHRFEEEHNKIIERFMPKLKKHFEKFGIPSSLYTIKWFMQCFLDRVPFSLAIRLWDIYIQEGELLLLVMSYNILKMHKDLLLKSSMEETINLLQTKFAIDFGYEDDIVIERLQQSWKELRKFGIDKMKTPKPELIKISEQAKKPFGIEVTESLNRQAMLSTNRNSANTAAVTANVALASQQRSKGKTVNEARQEHGVAVSIVSNDNGYANTNNKDTKTMNFVDSLNQMKISTTQIEPAEEKNKLTRMSPSRFSEYDNLNKNSKGDSSPPEKQKRIYNSTSSPLHQHVEPIPLSPITRITISDKRKQMIISPKRNAPFRDSTTVTPPSTHYNQATPFTFNHQTEKSNQSTPTNSPRIVQTTPTNSPRIVQAPPTNSPRIVQAPPTNSPRIVQAPPTNSPHIIQTTPTKSPRIVQATPTNNKPTVTHIVANNHRNTISAPMQSINQKRVPSPPSLTSNGSPVQYVTVNKRSTLTPVISNLPASHTTGDLYRPPAKVAYL